MHSIVEQLNQSKPKHILGCKIFDAYIFVTALIKTTKQSC